MSTINPILNSVAQTAYASITAPDQKPDAKQTERLLEREPPKTTASGNSTVTLSEAAMQKLNAEQELSNQQTIQQKESVETSARQDERNEAGAGLAYGSQVNERV